MRATREQGNPHLLVSAIFGACIGWEPPRPHSCPYGPSVIRQKEYGRDPFFVIRRICEGLVATVRDHASR